MMNHTLRILLPCLIVLLIGFWGVAFGEESYLNDEQVKALSTIIQLESYPALREAAQNLLDAEKNQVPNPPGGLRGGFGGGIIGGIGKSQPNKIKEIKQSAQDLVASAEASSPSFQSPAFKCLEEHRLCKASGKIGELGCALGLCVCWAQGLIPLAGEGESGSE